jgi:hypothetical protein
MKKYVLYTRDKTGVIERKGFATFLCCWPQIPYVHGETLAGWPEQKVFWQNEEGPSIGIAPVALINSNPYLKV